MSHWEVVFITEGRALHCSYPRNLPEPSMHLRVKCISASVSTLRSRLPNTTELHVLFCQFIAREDSQATLRDSNLNYSKTERFSQTHPKVSNRFRISVPIIPRNQVLRRENPQQGRKLILAQVCELKSTGQRLAGFQPRPHCHAHFLIVLLHLLLTGSRCAPRKI